MKVDVAKLRGRIVERGFTQEKLAGMMGMDKSTFSRKLQSEALNFSVGEMHQLVKFLKLSKRDAEDIFLS